MRSQSQPKGDEAQTKESLALHQVYLGLGSNVGDRDGHLRFALAAMPPAVQVKRVSAVYDTAPLIFIAQPRFHNIACKCTTRLEPLLLLRLLKDIERRAGRVDGPRYSPRPLDIDILLYDDLVLTTEELTVPHPGITQRVFVLAPLAEIAPRIRHPVEGSEIADLLAAAGNADVHRLGPL
jgi:2-amino-4-hydroxy-6-hydroxymethyldihydropteridine diphosphokinase